MISIFFVNTIYTFSKIDRLIIFSDSKMTRFARLKIPIIRNGVTMILSNFRLILINMIIYYVKYSQDRVPILSHSEHSKMSMKRPTPTLCFLSIVLDLSTGLIICNGF